MSGRYADSLIELASAALYIRMLSVNPTSTSWPDGSGSMSSGPEEIRHTAQTCGTANHFSHGSIAWSAGRSRRYQIQATRRTSSVAPIAADHSTILGSSTGENAHNTALHSTTAEATAARYCSAEVSM